MKTQNAQQHADRAKGQRNEVGAEYHGKASVGRTKLRGLNGAEEAHSEANRRDREQHRAKNSQRTTGLSKFHGDVR